MLLALCINTLLIILSVSIHFIVLRFLALGITYDGILHVRLIIDVLIAIAAHIVEIVIFGIVFFFMHQQAGLGQLAGGFDGSLIDCLYYSFTTYTSLGIGDIEPEGWLRFTTGVETLVGLVLITWTASFLYLLMEREWAPMLDKPD